MLLHTDPFLLVCSISGILCSLILVIAIPRYRTFSALKVRLDKFSVRRSETAWSQKQKKSSLKNQFNRAEKRINEVLNSSSSAFKNLRVILYRSGFQRYPDIHLVFFIFLLLGISFCLVFFLELPLLKSISFSFIFSSFIVWCILKWLAQRWVKSFLVLFPQALDIINRGLKAGLTLGRGIAMVSDEIANPVGFEFRYIAAQLQIGVSTEKALSNAAERIDLEDFRFFSLSLTIQKEMGGSLSEILRKLAEVIREREKFRKKVSSLSAEARTTAIIVGVLPFFAAVGIELISPGYLKFFVTDPSGQTMGMIMGSLILISVVVLRKMIRLET